MAKSAAPDGRKPNPNSEPRAADPGEYQVVARRYRPQSFADVVGQDHVVQAVANAIKLNRVTHAYLFCGTRGVGKTSIARIFAKCLNCERGPTVEPCGTCDICRAIAQGQDVDVIEIDGASNNGVDAVRELRQNTGLRPSRARYKIYYIDEVHMLTTGAFNALLKTLEEPPEHVKFLFATTEVQKIPITVLSRCQRYDFASITPERIEQTLRAICHRENVDVEPEALRAVARRASGSMRDAQSLLEQLLSSGEPKVTAEAVHRLLGLADDDQLMQLVEAVVARDAAATLLRVDAALASGIQPADLLNGLMEYLRDMMILGAGAELALVGAPARHAPRLRELAQAWSLDTVLAALQIASETRARLRGSPHGKLLVELGLARLARLERFDELSELLERLAGAPAAPKTPANGAPPPASTTKSRVPTPNPAANPRPEKKNLIADRPAPPAPLPRHTNNPDTPPRPQSAPRPAAPATATATATATAPTPAGPPPDPAISAPWEAGDGFPEDRPATPPELDLDAIREAWPKLWEAANFKDRILLGKARPRAMVAPNHLALALPRTLENPRSRDELPALAERLSTLIRDALGRSPTITFEWVEPDDEPPPVAASIEILERDPFSRKLQELFEARPIKIERAKPAPVETEDPAADNDSPKSAPADEDPYDPALDDDDNDDDD